MPWFALALALLGAATLAVAGVADLPRGVVGAALLAWLASFVLLVVLAVRRARREGRSFLGGLGLVLRETGRFVRDFLP